MGLNLRFSVFWIKLLGIAILILLLSAFIKPKEKELSQSKLDSIGMGTSTHLRVGTEGLPGAYQQLEEMNIHWIREEIPWREIEQIPGQYQWYYSDGFTDRNFQTMLEEARNHDLEVVAVLTTGPAYLPHLYPDQSIDVDLLVENWGHYVQAVVDRFGEQIDYWEIIPKANNSAVWGDLMFPTNPEAISEPNSFLYARLLSTANEIIKDHNRKDTVILGGLYGSMENSCATSPIKFLSDIKEAGAWNDFDVIGLTPYWQNNPPEAWIPRGPIITTNPTSCDPSTTQNSNQLNEVRMARDFSQENGNKPIWITELGWHESWLTYPADQHFLTYDQVEANYVVRSIIPLMSEEGVEKVFWNTLYEDPQNPGFALGPNGQQTLSNLGRLLGGARPLGQFQEFTSYGTPQDQGIYEFRFRKEGRLIIYAWTASGGQSPYPITFTDLPGKNYRAYPADTYDLSMDAGMELSTNPDQSLTIYVNEFPVVLIQQNSNLFASLSHRVEDGVSRMVDNQKDKVDSWFQEQINQLGEKVLDWAEEKVYDILNRSFDKIEEDLFSRN